MNLPQTASFHDAAAKLRFETRAFIDGNDKSLMARAVVLRGSV